MAQPIISAENIGKRYRLQHQAKQPYSTLRDTLTAQAKRLFGGSSAADASHADSEEEFWALKEVNFEIQQGDVVGIIGRNGAGKSTLLKVLSRIVEPTTGRITLRGRVASLLEVGTGFHPELTGRENVFLNGAILGMSKAEIRSKFDEIVAFAEVEKFLDTPVKHYSSGMYVRLAFAVAAHLEPEILIVDEVLAVGDAQFQQKCLGKIQSVAVSGRTVIFVSHHMPSVQRLCSRAIYLRNGRVLEDGPTEGVVATYMAPTGFAEASTDLTLLPQRERRGNRLAQFTRIEFLDTDRRARCEFQQGEPILVRLTLVSETQLEGVLIGFSFVSADGVEIQGTTAQDSGIRSLRRGASTFECEANPMVLCPGQWQVRGAIFRTNELFDHIDAMATLRISNTAHRVDAVPINHAVGRIYLPYNWRATD